MHAQNMLNACSKHAQCMLKTSSKHFSTKITILIIAFPFPWQLIVTQNSIIVTALGLYHQQWIQGRTGYTRQSRVQGWSLRADLAVQTWFVSHHSCDRFQPEETGSGVGQEGWGHRAEETVMSWPTRCDPCHNGTTWQAVCPDRQNESTLELGTMSAFSHKRYQSLV